jgi:hypothetical protein
MEPFATGGRYINFLPEDDSEGPDHQEDAYGKASTQRLAALKRRYDPSNIFRLNHNISPDWVHRT